jgi:hypothetical protein
MIFTVATSKHKKTSNGILKKKDFKREVLKKDQAGRQWRIYRVGLVGHGPP